MYNIGAIVLPFCEWVLNCAIISSAAYRCIDEDYCYGSISGRFNPDYRRWNFLWVWLFHYIVFYQAHYYLHMNVTKPNKIIKSNFTKIKVDPRFTIHLHFHSVPSPGWWSCNGRPNIWGNWDNIPTEFHSASFHIYGDSNIRHKEWSVHTNKTDEEGR